MTELSTWLDAYYVLIFVITVAVTASSMLSYVVAKVTKRIKGEQE